MNETKGSKTLFETTTETQKLLSKLLPFPPFFSEAQAVGRHD